MNKQRRLFLTQLSAIAGVAAINKPLNSVAAVSKHINTIHSSARAVTVYHTNNLHGKMGSALQQLGGINQVKELIERQNVSGLMCDAGDFLGDTQNLAEHKYIIRTMNGMGYHAATPGNNELMRGQEYLAKLLPLMKFTLVNCNYGFDAILKDLIKPYITINTGNFKVGITGVGKPLDGIIYNDAIKYANETARLLREKENCDLVICLSHLGDGEGRTPGNRDFVKMSENIDMIIADRSGKLVKGPRVIRNAEKKQVILNQAGYDGLITGKTIFTFASKQQNDIKAKYFIPGQSSDQTFGQSWAIIRSKQIAG